MAKLDLAHFVVGNGAPRLSLSARQGGGSVINLGPTTELRAGCASPIYLFRLRFERWRSVVHHMMLSDDF